MFRRPKRQGAFRVGDRVSANRLGYEGDGVVLDISLDFERGLGTKTFRSFLVELSSGERDWYKGISLTKLS